jgi:hypothetical protein
MTLQGSKHVVEHNKLFTQQNANIKNIKNLRTQNKRREKSMPQVGFEPTIPVLERDIYIKYNL